MHTKKIQSIEFDCDKKISWLRITQVDFAMNFTPQPQNEVQSALWSRIQVILFTIASFYQNHVAPSIIVSENVSKDKRTVAAFLNLLFENTPNIQDKTIDEVIWSDGAGSEFKNKFIICTLQFLAKK